MRMSRTITVSGIGRSGKASANEGVLRFTAAIRSIPRIIYTCIVYI
jgi:hypothetical protein